MSLVSKLRRANSEIYTGDQRRAQAWVDGKVDVFINNVSIETANVGSFYVDKGDQIGLWYRNLPGGYDHQDDKYIQEDLLYEKMADTMPFPVTLVEVR